MNGKNKTSASNPLSEMREGLADEWASPEVEMTAAEREVLWAKLNATLLKADKDIDDGNGIPAEIVFAKAKSRIQAAIDAQKN